MTAENADVKYPRPVAATLGPLMLGPLLLCPLLLCLSLVLLAVPLSARAGEADVVAVEAVPERAGTWRFNVTVLHADTGWEHYADRWDIVAPDGTVLGSRKLLHPHVDEQPFTRSLGAVAIPADVTEVTVRAHDSEHGLGGKTVTVSLER